MALYVGVDGGGSKTQVFLFDDESKQSVSCTGAGSNPNSVGWDDAISEVESLIKRCLQWVAAAGFDISGLSLCMSGVDRPEQMAAMRREMKRRYPRAVVEVVNDALAALSAGTRGKPGIVLIAGTGSIAVGESGTGKIARAGGFGYLIGDEGSGFQIGRAGIMAAMQSAEGRGPDTALWSQLQDLFQVTGPSEIIPHVYDARHPVQKIASFARAVIESAEDDLVAREIIQEALDHHVKLVQSVERQLADEQSNTLVLSGGVFVGNHLLAKSLQRRLPSFRCKVLEISAASGAALRAALLYLRETGTEDVSRLLAGWDEKARCPLAIPTG